MSSSESHAMGLTAMLGGMLFVVGSLWPSRSREAWKSFAPLPL